MGAAEWELLAGLATLNVLLKALAMSWKAEGGGAALWLSDASPFWPECVWDLSALVSACT